MKESLRESLVRGTGYTLAAGVLTVSGYFGVSTATGPLQEGVRLGNAAEQLEEQGPPRESIEYYDELASLYEDASDAYARTAVGCIETGLPLAVGLCLLIATHGRRDS